MKKALWIAAFLFGVCCFPAIAQPSLQTLVTNGLAEPYGVAVDDQNNIYVTDSAHNRITKVGANSGILTNFAGTFERGANNGNALSATFYNPQGIVYVRARNALAVADSGNHVIREINLANNTVSTIAGSFAPGTNDGAGLSAKFNSPAGLAVDNAGNIFVADMLNNRIRKIDGATHEVTTIQATFSRPSALAFGEQTEPLFVADTGNHSIYSIKTDGTEKTLIAGSESSSKSGDTDSLFGSQATFRSPRGLVWGGAKVGLLVSDTGNSLIRRVFFNKALGTNSVERFAGLDASKLSAPISLAVDKNGDFPLVDLANNSLLVIRVTPPQDPIEAPVIGIVNLTTNSFGQLVTALTPIVDATFNNDVKVAILAETGTSTHFTLDKEADLEGNPQQFDQPAFYANGLLEWANTIVDPVLHGSNVTVRAISIKEGRRPSPVVTARFQFQVANPTIKGNNPLSIVLEVGTTDATIRYTRDGTSPTSSSLLYEKDQKLNMFDISTNDVTFKLRAFKDGYTPSAELTRTFKFSDLTKSPIGFTRNFSAGIGSTLVVPVEVTVIPGETLRSLQFRAEVTPKGTAPAITGQFRALTLTPNDFVKIPVAATNVLTKADTYSSGGVTVARLTLLYLGTSSGLEASGNAKIAMLAVPIPPTATAGQTYTLSVVEPSGTSDGKQAPVLMTPMENRTITITNISYVVGDTAVGGGYNAGDFGNGNLGNNDVNNAFQASLGIGTPFPFTDVFDAMDAFPVDTADVVGGDGQIRFLDWQIILDRSLRKDTNNWSRAWTTDGGRKATSATLKDGANSPAESASAGISGSIWEVQGQVGGVQVANVASGSAARVPVNIKLAAGARLAGFQFRAVIEPVGNGPALNQAARFEPASGIPAPIAVENLGVNEVGGAWSPLVNGFASPLSGETVVGDIVFTVPANAQAGQQFVVRFVGVDGAPDLQTQYDLLAVDSSVWTQSGGSVPSTAAAVLNGFKVSWFGAQGRHYEVESTADLAKGNWTVIARDLLGRGRTQEFVDQDASSPAKFYRVVVQP